MALNNMLHQGVGMTSQRARDRLVIRLRKKGIRHSTVLQSIARTPRHLFVDEALSHRAYEDNALPIGNGQTISQPYIVALMTETILKDGIPGRVLEIGTGSGYQAAILAHIVPAVFSVERISGLLVQAKKRFKELKINNIMVKHGDGTNGWPQPKPYNAIIITAAPEAIPTPLLEQLSVGGRMIVPVGQDRSVQELRSILRTKKGYETTVIETVSFVPFRSGKA